MTTGAGASGADSPLVRALRVTLAALEARDLQAAAAAVAEVVAACDDAARAGVRLPAQDLAVARELQARCEALALETQAAVVAELLHSATRRKASDAYGSGT